MLLVFSWKPALEMPRYVKIQIFLFLKARRLEIVAENLTNSTKSGNVDTYDIKKTLYESHIVPILQCTHIN